MYAPQLTISPEHEYSIGPRKLSGVTKMIRTFFPMAWQPGEYYLERGKALHDAIHLEARGKMDSIFPKWEAAVIESQRKEDAEKVLNKFAAYKKFAWDLNFIPSISEQRMHSEKLGFAGTLDAVGTINADPTSILFDWKSSCELLPLMLQLGLYSLLYTENTGARLCKAAGLILNNDGSYKLVWGTRNPKRDNARFDLTIAESGGRNLVSLYALKERYQ